MVRRVGRAKPPILHVRNVTVRRGPTFILRDLDWRVEQGQNWVILGANGSGKTSLLSVLTGYLMPSSGAFSLLGHHYGEEDWRELRKQIGLVSSAIRQMMPDGEPALESVVSGRHAMIDFWGEIRPGERRTALRLLRAVECAHLAQRPWLFLSQGERQRILIARALMATPPLLILDEPCAGLDPAAREHFLQFLQRIGQRRGGPCLILVTHHVEEIMPIFSHVLALKSGEVLAMGPKAQVLNNRTLSQTFHASIRLYKRQTRYCLRVRPASRGVL